MALRVKNIQQGFVDATGFHPIRSSSDYDSGRTGETKKRKTKAKATTKRRKVKATTKRRKVTSSRPAVKRAKKTKYQTSAYKRRVKRAPVRRKRNPGSNLDQRAFEAGKRWATHGADESGVANARVRRYGFLKWWNNLSPAESKGVKKTSMERDFNEGYKVAKSPRAAKNPIPTTRWVTAKVKRTASGDVKIMIPGATVRR